MYCLILNKYYFCSYSWSALLIYCFIYSIHFFRDCVTFYFDKRTYCISMLAIINDFIYSLDLALLVTWKKKRRKLRMKLWQGCQFLKKAKFIYYHFSKKGQIVINEKKPNKAKLSSYIGQNNQIKVTISYNTAMLFQNKP